MPARQSGDAIILHRNKLAAFGELAQRCRADRSTSLTQFVQGSRRLCKGEALGARVVAAALHSARSFQS
jgi:hypothetical protein